MAIGVARPPPTYQRFRRFSGPSAYRPLATSTNRGEEPETLEAKAPLMELHATASPSIASAAAWVSRARIGSP